MKTLRLLASLCGLACLITASWNQPIAASSGNALDKHIAAMQAVVETFATNPVVIKSVDGDPADNQRIQMHWQYGKFRQEYHWLGFTEVFGYNGEDHWYGSMLNLPYAMDSGSGINVTPQLVSNFAYLLPDQLPFLHVADDAPLSLGQRYVVLRYTPPNSSEALLLLDPFDYRLIGMLHGSNHTIANSALYNVITFEDWSDYGACWYPTMIRTTTLSLKGEVLKEKLHTTLSVEIAEPLDDWMFDRMSSPAVPTPMLPQVPYIVPFYFSNQTVVVKCQGPDGRELKLEVDTGANVGLLRRDVAQDLGLDLTGEEHLTGHGGMAEVEYARIEGVRLEGVGGDLSVEIPPWPAAVLKHNTALDESLAQHGVDGLLGNFLLNNFVIKLDYRRKRLLLYPPCQFNPALHLGDNYSAIPVTRGRMPYFQVIVDDVIKGGAFFNTGDQRFFTLSAWAAKEAGIEYEVESTSKGITLQGSTVFGVIRPDKVQIGDLVIHKPRTHLELLAPVEAPNPNRIASFGNEFFNLNLVTLDLFHKMYYIEGI